MDTLTAAASLSLSLLGLMYVLASVIGAIFPTSRIGAACRVLAADLRGVVAAQKRESNTLPAPEIEPAKEPQK